MAFITDVISDEPEGMCLEVEGACTKMWNFYSDSHPHLHDNFMDPPKHIMLHPEHKELCHTDREVFDVFYGVQTHIELQCTPTVSPVFEVQRSDFGTPQNHLTVHSNHSTKIHKARSTTHLTVPSHSNKASSRRKSDTDLGDIKLMKTSARGRFNSNGHEDDIPSASLQINGKQSSRHKARSTSSLSAKQDSSTLRESLHPSNKDKHKSHGFLNKLQKILS